MILKVEGGCYSYPEGGQILNGISLDVREGRMLSVLGPNGVGKTTLLKCMTGILPWRSGRSLLLGRDIRRLKPREIWSDISYIPQSHSFAFSFSGLEMVIMGRSAHLGPFAQPGKKEREQALELMEKLHITSLSGKDCNQMSGGELQMVLIAKALINHPKLIILDEPETGLDFHNQLLVLDMIDRLVHEEGIAAVMNTHYPTNALAIADEAFMMDREGSYISGAVREVLCAENIARAFRVRVVVNEIHFKGKGLKSIVPVELIPEEAKTWNEREGEDKHEERSRA